MNNLDNYNEKKIKKIIDYLKNKYFNEDTKLVEDNVYDYIKEYYEDKFDKIIDEVGSTINNKNDAYRRNG